MIANVNLEVRRFEHQLRLLRHWWLYAHRPYTPLFVLASFRSGSNLLMDYLCQLPNVGCRGEVLCRTIPIGPRRSCLPPRTALQHIKYSLQGLKTPVRSCKLMLEQLANCRLTADVIDATFPAAKYIVLYRQSLAEQFVSFKTALATKQWVLRAGESSRNAPITIDPSELRAYCDRMQTSYQGLLSQPWLAQKAVLISYEELIVDAWYWLREHISALIGVAALQPVTRLCKQATQPLEQRVKNYRDVAKLFASPLCWQHYTLQLPANRRSA